MKVSWRREEDERKEKTERERRSVFPAPGTLPTLMHKGVDLDSSFREAACTSCARITHESLRLRGTSPVAPAACRTEPDIISRYKNLPGFTFLERDFFDT